MSYDYEKYDGKRYVVDGEIIGLLAMEYGHEVEAVFDEYHAEVALTPEQERQAEAYHENLRTTLCAQYKKVDGLQAENARLRALARMHHAVISFLCDIKTAPDEVDVFVSKTWLEDFQIEVKP